MNPQSNPPEKNDVSYELNKTTFLVKPVYKEDGQESVADILLKLMLNDI